MKERFVSDRLAMRPHEAGDAAALHAGYGDADLMRWWATPPHASIEETRAYLVGDDDDDDEEAEGEDAWQGWTVTLGDTPIGTLSAGRRRSGVVEIGYLLVRAHWGHGYGREMVARLVTLLFEDEGARRVYADVDPDNAASVALLTGLGFRLEGRLREAWASHIGIRDALILALLEREWRAGPADPRAAKARAAAMLVRPIRLMALVLAATGIGLALVPGVPRLIAGLVAGIGLVQLVVAIVLRKTLRSP